LTSGPKRSPSRNKLADAQVELFVHVLLAIIGVDDAMPLRPLLVSTARPLRTTAATASPLERAVSSPDRSETSSSFFMCTRVIGSVVIANEGAAAARRGSD